MKHVLLIGRNGQLGKALLMQLEARHTVTAVGRAELDLADSAAISRLISRLRPDLIVNAAAYTDVDGAEEHRDLALRVNAEAPGAMARAARHFGCGLIHFSTDFVFDGRQSRPYRESDQTNPLSHYGATKLLGEQYVQSEGGGHLVLRTSWVYGPGKASFTTKVRGWARRHEVVRIVLDQEGSPTWCNDLARVTSEIIDQVKPRRSVYEWLEEKSGIYHAGGLGIATRYEWAKAIINLDPHPEQIVTTQIVPASTDEFPVIAQRPAFSGLDCTRLRDTFGVSLKPWSMSLREALQGRPD